MAYAMYGEIRFPANKGRQDFKIRRFSAVKVDTSWRSLTDTAEITLPRKTRDFNRFQISKWFREGDPVEVWLGYNGKLILEFTGYIAMISVGIPLVLRLENETYMLKRKTVSVSLQNCSLKKLLQTIVPEYKIECDETKITGSVLYENRSVSEILEDLKKTGINSWFEGKTLHAFGTSKSDISPIHIILEKSASESLKQKAVEKTHVTVSILRKVGRKLKVEYGDKGAGKRISREYSGVNMSLEDMLKEAKEVYAQAMLPGLDGDITLFGIPRIQHGMRVALKSLLYPEKNEVYYVDAVTKTFDNSGYRQVCKLGDKAV